MNEPRTAEALVAEGAVELPEPPEPSGHYARAVIGASFLDVSGQVAAREGQVRTGRVGVDVSLHEAQDLAAAAAANAVAIARAEHGTLENLLVHRLRVYVAGSDTFTDQHLVADGASRYLTRLFGAMHSRTSVGVAALPLGAPVEVEVSFRVLRGPEDSGGTDDRSLSERTTGRMR